MGGLSIWHWVIVLVVVVLVLQYKMPIYPQMLILYQDYLVEQLGVY